MIGSLIGAGLSVASSIAGNIASRRQRKAARELVEQQLRDNRSWRDRNYFSDVTKRGDTICLLERTRELLRERARAARGRQAVMGGTEGSVSSVMEANNRALADTVGNIVSANEARKDRVDAQAQAVSRQLKGELTGMKLQDAENTAQTTQQVAGVASHIANGLDGIASGGQDGGDGDLSPVSEGQREVNELERLVNQKPKV